MGSKKEQQGKFCSRPFEWLEIQGRKVHFCCPGWTTLRGEDCAQKSLLEVWNSETAKAFRASILDGSFRYCNDQECPFLNQHVPVYWEPNGPPVMDRGQVRDERLKDIILNDRIVLDDGPTVLNCGYDGTCNLSCPSCRPEVVGLNREGVEREVAFQKQVMDEIGRDLRILYLSGHGDPFASQVYKQLLMSLNKNERPELEVHVHTNGQLWTEQRWQAFGSGIELVQTAHISIDAAQKDTYEELRRGARWEILMENLERISRLRQSGKLRFVTLSFVVQDKNFRQMRAFIEIKDRFGFDLVYFHQFCNWAVTPEEYMQRAVHKPWHADYHEFLKMLTDDVFARPDVGLYCLQKCRLRALRVSRLGRFGFLFFQYTSPVFHFIARKAPRLLKMLAKCGKLFWH